MFSQSLYMAYQLKIVFLFLFLFPFFFYLNAEDLQFSLTEKKTTEEESETIQKCLRDLQSDNPDTRQSAVLLLGKYNDREATSALIKALKDKDANVRRSALVSIVEDMIIPNEATFPVVRMLSDDDVHIRRIASSSMKTMNILMSRSIFIPNQNGGGNFINNNIPKDIIEIIEKAFSDKDATVRKNMISLYYIFKDQIKPEVLIKLLDDEDKEIKLIAIENIARGISPKQYRSKIGKLAEDDDPRVRQKIAQSIKFLGTEAQMEKILINLLDDKAINVRGEAVTGLLLHRRINDMNKIYDIIMNPELDIEIGRQIVSFLSMAGNNSIPLLKKIFQEGQSFYRALALNSYLQLNPDIDKKEIIGYLNDTNPEIRRTAFIALIRRQDLDKNDFLQIAQNPDIEVRKMLVPNIWQSHNDKILPAIEELLFDESVEIRRSAISAYARKKLPEYMKVLEQSLEDENPEIIGCAADELRILNTDEARSLIEKYKDKIGQNQSAPNKNGIPALNIILNP